MAKQQTTLPKDTATTAKGKGQSTAPSMSMDAPQGSPEWMSTMQSSMGNSALLDLEEEQQQCIDPAQVSQQEGEVSSSEPDEDQVCEQTDPVADFETALYSADLPGANSAISLMDGQQRKTVSRDPFFLSLIADTFPFANTIKLYDALGADTTNAMFLEGRSLIMGFEMMCSPDFTAFLKRCPDGVFTLMGVFAPANVAVQWESMYPGGGDIAALMTRLESLSASVQLQFMTGLFQKTQHDLLLAIQQAGKLDALLKGLPPAAVASLTAMLPEQGDTKEQMEDKAKKSDNPKRAETALAELKAKQAADTNNPKRITDGIVSLLVWGVGKEMNATSLGNEGIIGIHHATNAADALMQMDQEAYVQIVSRLVMAGSDAAGSDRQTESVLILKAVAARKQDFIAKKDQATKDVDKFGDDIRGKDAEQLKKDTSTRDHGDGQGLQQKFTMTCGPTSIQMTHGESDPIYAMEVSKTAKHTLDYKNDVAKEQKDYLAKDVVPRTLKPRWQAFQAAAAAHVTATPADVGKIQALNAWISGGAADAAALAQGKAWATGAGFTNDELADFKKYFPFNEPGWGNSTFQNKANAEIKDPTNASFNERAIPGEIKKVAGKKTAISGMKKTDTNPLYEALFRGRDVPMGIMWTNGGGHFMVFTDCKTEKVGGNDVRFFLLSDPGAGTSAWITEDNVLKGDISPFGKGYIDSIYL